MRNKHEEKIEDWNKIYEDFNKITDLRNFIPFLQSLILKLKVCRDSKCQIFENIHALEQKRKCLKHFSLETAKKEIKTTNEYLRFEEQYNLFINECNATFDYIFRLYANKLSQNEILEDSYEKGYELIDNFNKNGREIPLELKGGLNKFLNDTIDNTPLDIEAIKQNLQKKKEENKQDGNK